MTTRQIEESILINCPPETVFAFISNYENDSRWRQRVLSMTHVPPGPAHVGMKTREVVRVMGRESVVNAEIVAFEPGKRADFTSPGPFTISGSRAVAAEGTASRFKYQLQVEAGGILGLLLPLLFRIAGGDVATDLNALKQIIESECS